MAADNRNTKHKRRLRRNVSLLTRTLRAKTQEQFNTTLALMAILAQQGGEVAVTTGTTQQVVEGVVKGQIRWTMVPGAAENEQIFRLVYDEVQEATELIWRVIDGGIGQSFRSRSATLKTLGYHDAVREAQDDQC